jgi:hypothetical protein
MANAYYGINGNAFDNIPGVENMNGYRLPPNVAEIVKELIDAEQGRGNNAAAIQNRIIMLQNEVGAMAAADRRKIVKAIGLLQGARDDARLPPPGFVDILERAREALNQQGNNNMQLNGGRKRTRRHRRRAARKQTKRRR